MDAPNSNRTAWLGFAIIWLVGTAAGLGAMAAYANRPGIPAQAPASWPDQSQLERDGSRPTLLVIAHPRCDCTTATLSELAQIMVRSRRAVNAFVLVVKPHGVGTEWDETSLWRQASAIPGVTVLRDVDGREAARFGAVTSGQALLYGTDNRLLFSGGLTAARGHEGPNDGENAVLRWLEGSVANQHTPVFGCSLLTSTSRTGEAQ